MKLEIIFNYKKIQIIFFIIVLLSTVGCSFNKYDLPFIGWRMEVAAERERYEKMIKKEIDYKLIQAIAKRIEAALDHGMPLEEDQNQQRIIDHDSIRQRYQELKSKKDFTTSARIARTEFVERILSDLLRDIE